MPGTRHVPATILGDYSRWAQPPPGGDELVATELLLSCSSCGGHSSPAGEVTAQTSKQGLCKAEPFAHGDTAKKRLGSEPPAAKFCPSPTLVPLRKIPVCGSFRVKCAASPYITGRAGSYVLEMPVKQWARVRTPE